MHIMRSCKHFNFKCGTRTYQFILENYQFFKLFESGRRTQRNTHIAKLNTIKAVAMAFGLIKFFMLKDYSTFSTYNKSY